MKKTRIGIIGTGGISHCHMMGYKELEAEGRVELVACCDIDEKKLGAFAEKYGFEQVNVIPQIHAGGAFAVKHYKSLKDPVVVESIDQRADAGIDIGGVMIGMHSHPVAVPLHLENRHIGEAVIIAARRRPKYVGGERAVYDPELA